MAGGLSRLRRPSKLNPHSPLFWTHCTRPSAGRKASRYLTASPDWKFARELWWTKRRLRIEAHAVRVQQMLRRIESRCRQHPGRGCRRAVWCIDLRRRFASLSEAARFVGRSPNSIIRAALSGGRCAGLQWEFCASRNKKVNAKTP
jgi:hypothetical protein